MKLAAAAILLAIFPAAAWAQGGPVQQSGSVTVGHVPVFVTNGVVGDGGSAQEGKLSEIGILNSGTPLCITDAPRSGPYHQLCIGANSLGAGLISFNAYGGAPMTPLNCNINGVTTACLVPGGNVFQSVTVGGNIDATGNINATGAIHAGGALSGSSLAVSGTTTVGGALGVTGLLSLAGGLDVSGLVPAGGGNSLYVNGAGLFTGNLDVHGDTGLGGALSVNGTTSLDGAVGVIGPLTLAGGLDVSGLVPGGAGNSLVVNGSGSFSSTLTAATLSSTGDTDVTGNLAVDGGANIGGAVGVTGEVVLAGGLDVSGQVASGGGNSLYVNGSGFLGGNLQVQGVGSVFSQGLVVDTPSGQLVGLQVNGGDLEVFGDGFANAWNLNSDKTLKTDITDYSHGLSVIRKLRPVSYRMSAVTQSGALHHGLIADDVATVAPEAVGTNKGVKTVDLMAVIGMLINANRELAVRLEALETKAGVQQPSRP